MWCPGILLLALAVDGGLVMAIATPPMVVDASALPRLKPRGGMALSGSGGDMALSGRGGGDMALSGRGGGGMALSGRGGAGAFLAGHASPVSSGGGAFLAGHASPASSGGGAFLAPPRLKPRSGMALSGGSGGSGGGAFLAGHASPVSSGGGAFLAGHASPVSTGGAFLAGHSSPVSSGGGAFLAGHASPVSSGGGAFLAGHSPPVSSGGGAFLAGHASPVSSGGAFLAGHASPASSSGGAFLAPHRLKPRHPSPVVGGPGTGSLSLDDMVSAYRTSMANDAAAGAPVHTPQPNVLYAAPKSQRLKPRHPDPILSGPGATSLMDLPVLASSGAGKTSLATSPVLASSGAEHANRYAPCNSLDSILSSGGGGGGGIKSSKSPARLKPRGGYKLSGGSGCTYPRGKYRGELTAGSKISTPLYVDGSKANARPPSPVLTPRTAT